MKQVDMDSVLNPTKCGIQTPLSPITSPVLPVIKHGLGHFQPYSEWSAPKMVVYSGKIKQRSSMHDPGFELVSTVDCVVSSRSSSIVSSGLSVQIPFGHFGRVEGLTPLAMQHGIVPFSSILDSECQSIINVKLFNHSNQPYRIQRGERIAQLVIQRYSAPCVVQQLSYKEVFTNTT
jgi:dUTP pyrophosphatase